MFKLLTMFVKQLAMLAAVCIILLAIAVGAFRLLLPQLPTYQGQIKSWAQDALGVRVDFSRLDARWGLQGPELTFFDARVGGSPETPTLAAERASIGISLLGLMTNRELLVDRVTLLGIDLLLERDPNGQFTLQQQPLVAGAGSRVTGSGRI